MKKVLVAGATGYLGQFVIREFKKQGFWIRALTRNPDKLKPVMQYIDEVFVGEVTMPDSLRGICKDIDIVFSSIGITKQRDNLTYMDVDYQGNKNLLDAAQMTSVSRFVYVSVFNADKMQNLKIIQAKSRFTKELKESGLNYSVVYPNGYFSDMLSYLQIAQKGRGYILGSGANKINPIHGQDLAEVCVNAAVKEEQEISIGGPDILTHRQILSIAFEVLGKPVKITRIPIWLRDFLLTLLRTFTSVRTYGPLEFIMTVLTIDSVAPAYGKYHLKDYFLENKNNV